MLAGGEGRSSELEPAVFQQYFRKIPHEIEYSGSLLLVLPEGLVVHEEVDNIPFGGLEPREELLTRERPVPPASVREPEGDVVTELVIPQKEPQRSLLIPEPSPTSDRARSYLIGRGIDPELIDFCIPFLHNIKI